jgi:hypothetical protein
LWQIDVVGGFLLTGGGQAKALTGSLSSLLCKAGGFGHR